eukprot:TRINITY_DN1267_c0_g1_i9.p1 TRINITY_DN1267_c0_g1~~TRINITY_DN1267_c0_g1_i9.p1  ORF type:complete len:474 (+),score=138.03 TRINITY_DN1267_c0_g1_i9:120-1424(+)
MLVSSPPHLVPVDPAALAAAFADPAQPAVALPFLLRVAAGAQIRAALCSDMHAGEALTVTTTAHPGGLVRLLRLWCVYPTLCSAQVRATVLLPALAAAALLERPFSVVLDDGCGSAPATSPPLLLVPTSHAISAASIKSLFLLLALPEAEARAALETGEARLPWDGFARACTGVLGGLPEVPDLLSALDQHSLRTAWAARQAEADAAAAPASKRRRRTSPHADSDAESGLSRSVLLECLAWLAPAVLALRRNEGGLLDLWARGFVCGFLDQTTAAAVLAGQSPGAFVLRFGAGMPAQLSASWKDAAGSVQHGRVAPEGVAAWLRDRPELGTLVQITAALQCRTHARRTVLGALEALAVPTVPCVTPFSLEVDSLSTSSKAGISDPDSEAAAAAASPQASTAQAAVCADLASLVAELSQGVQGASDTALAAMFGL